MLEELAALLCVCSYQLLCEIKAEGEVLGTLIYFDDGPHSETRGQQVRSCPGCGEKLGLQVLRARKNLSLW